MAINLNRIYKLIGAIAAVLSIIGSLNTCFGVPFPSLLLFDKHTVTRIENSPDFKIEAIKTRQGISLNRGENFSYRFGIPLSLRGVTMFPNNAKVWVVTVDMMGHFYLQHPPVPIRSGEWIATNIRPLKEIQKIVFVRVGAEGNSVFTRKVEHNEWGKFTVLPPDTKELVFVELE